MRQVFLLVHGVEHEIVQHLGGFWRIDDQELEV
jgi:hypothetical protein